MPHARQATNVELVLRVFGESVWGADIVSLLGDDERWTSYRRDVEPYLTEDCRFAWIAFDARIERVGADGLRAGWLEWFKPWAEYTSTIDTMTPRGDQVLVLAHHAGVRHDGTTVELQAAAVFGFENGRIASGDFYARREEALAAAGET